MSLLIILEFVDVFERDPSETFGYLGIYELLIGYLGLVDGGHDLIDLLGGEVGE